MKNTKNNLMKGFISLIAMIIAAILVIGGGTYFVVKKSGTQKVAEVETNIGDISASIPSLDFSASPLPDLNVSSLNVGVVQSNTKNIFSAPNVNTNFSFQTNLDIKVPSVSASDLNFQMPSAPTNNQPGNTNVGSPDSAPQGGGTQPSAGASQPSVDCSQFAQVPSCSYISDPNGQAACKKCFPNK